MTPALRVISGKLQQLEPQTDTRVSCLVHKRLNLALGNGYADPCHHLRSFCVPNIHRYLATFAVRVGISVHVEASKRNTQQSQGPHTPRPVLPFERFLQQQRIQRCLVRAVADMGSKLCESTTHEDELVVEEQRSREGDARHR